MSARDQVAQADYRADQRRDREGAGQRQDDRRQDARRDDRRDRRDDRDDRRDRDRANDGRDRRRDGARDDRDRAPSRGPTRSTQDRTRSTYRRPRADRANVLAEVDEAKAEVAMLIARSKDTDEVAKLERQFDRLDALSRNCGDDRVEQLLRFGWCPGSALTDGDKPETENL